MAHARIKLTYSDYLKTRPIILKPAPSSFDGPFSTFYAEYVEPNLPKPERVFQFDQSLRQYCLEADTKLIIRQLKKLNRGETYTTESGATFTPSDNSPGWWLHALLVSDVPLAKDPISLFQEMPTRMFEIPKMKTLSRYGFHLAHIDDVKNRDTKWEKWNRSELERRFILNVHPCNWFLLSKIQWRKWGGDKAIQSWMRDKYRSRYGKVLGLSANGDTQQKVAVESARSCRDTHYSYGHHGIDADIPEFSNMPRHYKTSNPGSAIKNLNRPHVCKGWIGQNILLSITFGPSQYNVDHDELLAWVLGETNVPNTKSWIHRGHYHWPRPSAKMLAFLKVFERKD